MGSYSNLIQRTESTLQRWLTRRQHHYSDSSTLDRKHIFIIPTRAGVCLGALLFLMLLTSLNYMNSMSMLLTFFVAGIAFNSAWLTYLNLKDLTVSRVSQKNLFVGEQGTFRIKVNNPTKRDRYGLVFRERNENLILHDVQAGDEIQVKMPITPERRGEYKLRRFAIATRMPVGIFNAWSWQTLKTSLWVFPEPIPNHPAPFAASGDDGECAPTSSQGEEFSNLRDYSQGDSIKHIAWKQQARHQKLLTKEFSESTSGSISLSWDFYSELDTETRLSYLCYWVLEAEKQNLEFSLSLPDDFYPTNSGEKHTQDCLLALARYPA